MVVLPTPMKPMRKYRAAFESILMRPVWPVPSRNPGRKFLRSLSLLFRTRHLERAKQSPRPLPYTMVATAFESGRLESSPSAYAETVGKLLYLGSHGSESLGNDLKAIRFLETKLGGPPNRGLSPWAKTAAIDKNGHFINEGRHLLGRDLGAGELRTADP